MKNQWNHGRALVIIPILMLVVTIQAGMLLKLTADQRLISQAYAQQNNKYFLARSGIYKAVDILNEIARDIETDENFYLQIHEKLINYCTYVIGGADEYRMSYAIEFYDNGLRSFTVDVTIRGNAFYPEQFYVTAYAKEEAVRVGCKIEAEVYYGANGQIEIKSFKEVK